MQASHSKLEQEVAALGDLSRDGLAALWTKAHGALPPKGVRRDLLIRSAAWHLQAKRLGGLSAEPRRLLRSAISRVENERVARDSQGGSAANDRVNEGQGSETALDVGSCAHVAAPPRQRRRLTPGARLVREWGGRTHFVDVIEGGYVFEAKVYSSLTAIAGRITGAHWSGPRFFGL
jgi:hypothetical protein